MIYVSCEFSTPLGRFHNEDYIRALELDVYSFDEVGKRIVLGKYGADQLLLSDAQVDAVNLFNVCDQDSQGLYEVYESLFGDNGDFQPELEVNDITDYVLFLWRSVLHPKVQPWEQAILEVLGTLFGHESVLSMWRSVTSLSDAKLVELGFAKIAGSNLLFRHMALQTPFSRAHPSGVEVPDDFDAIEEDQAWVLSRWNNDNPPQPYEPHETSNT